MSNDEITKLSVQMQKGFATVNKKLVNHDKRFDSVDTKLTGHDKSFENFFKYIQDSRAELTDHIEESKREHANILAAVAELSAEVKDFHVEIILASKKVDRLAEAVREIAAKTGVKLKFDF